MLGTYPSTTHTKHRQCSDCTDYYFTLPNRAPSHSKVGQLKIVSANSILHHPTHSLTTTSFNTGRKAHHSPWHAAPPGFRAGTRPLLRYANTRPRTARELLLINYYSPSRESRSPTRPSPHAHRVPSRPNSRLSTRATRCQALSQALPPNKTHRPDLQNAAE